MRAAALESGRGAPLRHLSRRHQGALVAKEKTSGKKFTTAKSADCTPGPSRIDMLPSAERKKNNGAVGPFLPPSQPSAVRCAFMTVYVAAPNGRCHGSGQNRTPLKLATKTTRLVVKGGGMMGSATLEACSSTRGAVLHGCDPCGTILARPLPVRLSIPY